MLLNEDDVVAGGTPRGGRSVQPPSDGQPAQVHAADAQRWPRRTSTRHWASPRRSRRRRRGQGRRCGWRCCGTAVHGGARCRCARCCCNNNNYPASLASTRPGQGVVGHQPAFRDFHPAGHHPPTAKTPGDLGSSIRGNPNWGEKKMVADPKCSFQAQTTSRWSAHWRFAFKPAPAGRGGLGLAPVRVTRSCSAAEAGPRLSQ